jgi:16S rRNA (uracil1498-N3)-methyltransferase
VTTPATAGAVAHVFVVALDDSCVVDGPDGHHLERVRRVRPGERVTAADGTGAWRPYDVATTARGSLTLHAAGPVAIEPAPAVPITVAVAPTKAGLDDVVAAVTELGVTEIIPVRTTRAVVRWDAARADRILERLRTIAREASMQSRRARVPVVAPPTDLAAIAARPGFVVADLAGHPADALPDPGPAGWTVVVGPEGGFDERDHAVMGAAPTLGLGPYVLRAATAPIAAAAVLMARATQFSRNLPSDP